jgi:hypothetical protein
VRADSGFRRFVIACARMKGWDGRRHALCFLNSAITAKYHQPTTRGRAGLGTLQLPESADLAAYDSRSRFYKAGGPFQ